VSLIYLKIISTDLDPPCSVMAVAIDQRVVEEVSDGVNAPDTYQSPLVQLTHSWDEAQYSVPERNLVSWALSGTYDEDIPVSVAAYKQKC
jgi:hypothetical protein